MSKKGGSKVVTAIIAFILGFVFALLVIVGSVFGVYFYVSTTDLDSLFNTLGIKNRDEEGNYVYVNTEEAKTLGELFTALQSRLFADGTFNLGLNIDELESVLPIVQSTLAKSLYPMLGNYADIDWDEFESTSLSELPMFLNNAMMDVRPAKLLSTMGMEGLVGEEANPLVRALLAGAEFEYSYYYPDGADGQYLKFPVYFDSYVYNDTLGDYYRVESVGGMDAFPTGLDKGLLYDTEISDENGNRIYNLYYSPVNFNNGYITDPALAPEAPDGATAEEIAAMPIYAEGTRFYAVNYDEAADIYILDAQSGMEYLYDYGMHNYDRTGNFYYDNQGEEIQIKPVSLRSFSDPDEVFKPLYSTRITEIMQGDVISSLFGRHSVGELLDQKIDIDECVNGLELSKVVAIDPEQSMMAYIGYGLKNVQKAESDDPSILKYTATIDIDGESVPCYVEADIEAAEGEQSHRAIKRVWYENSEGEVVEVSGTKVKEVSSKAIGMEMSALLDVKANDAILCYIGYGLFGVTEEAGEGYTHTAQCDIIQEDGEVLTVDAYIATDGEDKVTGAWYYDGENKKLVVPGTTVNSISKRISMLKDRLALPDVLDIKADQNITVYIGYGVTGLTHSEGENAGGAYSYKGLYKIVNPDETVDLVEAYISADEETGKVKSVWYIDGPEKKAIAGTSINAVGERIQNITKDLSMGDVISVKADQKITVYIGYGITGVTAAEGEDLGYTHTGKYKIAGTEEGTFEEVTAYILADTSETADNGKIISAWYMKGDEKVAIQGTPIADIPAKVENISNDLTLGDIMNIQEDDKILWALRDSKIADVGKNVKTLRIKDILDESQLERRTILSQLANTTIDNLSTDIDKISIQSLYIEQIYGKQLITSENKADYVPSGEFDGSVLYLEEAEDGSFVYVNADSENDDRVGVLTQNEYDAGKREGKTYYTYGKAQGMWKLILMINEDMGGSVGYVKHEKLYTINNLHNMIQRSAENVNSATLGELKEAKIISESVDLSGTLRYGLGQSQSKVLKDITLQELIGIVVDMTKVG